MLAHSLGMPYTISGHPTDLEGQGDDEKLYYSRMLSTVELRCENPPTVAQKGQYQLGGTKMHCGRAHPLPDGRSDANHSMVSWSPLAAKAKRLSARTLTLSIGLYHRLVDRVDGHDAGFAEQDQRLDEQSKEIAEWSGRIKSMELAMAELRKIVADLQAQRGPGTVVELQPRGPALQ